ncbi:MAG: DUF2138 family protein [Sulfuricurvum sp.]|uniref:DUF2138 family protein n=1 Tax=Sulfuricurvum sp. TaxID=2025608 RepID=UPI0026220E5F|nr:DUF2138 family protein [Sulfuricurvum sp.]MDD2830314.1 DUF2138 family protein [Sulfuricurvum sp.]MDD4950414.1 DUF2138 family protein [Sulfuricurvum sp.]
MRRIWLAIGFITLFATVIIAVGLNSTYNLKPYKYAGTELTVDLSYPDGYIQTQSLATLPSDLLRIPIVHDVFTEDLAFYYNNHEDRMGFGGAIKRIAYEHDLDWSDKVLASALNEPAEIAFWRDGHGGLRHYALILKRNIWSKIIQEAATVSADDTQLTKAGEIKTKNGKVTVFSLEINPRRTFLIVSNKENLVVLSDPGLLMNNDGNISDDASNVIEGWLDNTTQLSKTFQLTTSSESMKHTLILRSSALALGYDPFIPGLEGIRFDFGESWSTSMWVNKKELQNSTLGDAQLWKNAPANPSACVVLPLDWGVLHHLMNKAETEDNLPPSEELKHLKGSLLACWYNESNLYSPLFILKSDTTLQNRNASLHTLAKWAIADKKVVVKTFPKNSDALLWSGTTNQVTIGAKDNYILFSPDRKLIEKAFDTMIHLYPNITDHVKTSDLTMALITPKPLSAMIEREVIAAVDASGDANLLAVTQNHLPPRMKALSLYPSYRLELIDKPNTDKSWYQLQWQNGEIH